MFRAPKSDEEVENRKRIVAKHFELEANCLRVIAECDQEIAKEKEQLLQELAKEVPGEMEEWFKRVGDPSGAGKEEGYGGLGFMERWFAV